MAGCLLFSSIITAYVHWRHGDKLMLLRYSSVQIQITEGWMLSLELYKSMRSTLIE